MDVAMDTAGRAATPITAGRIPDRTGQRIPAALPDRHEADRARIVTRHN